MGAVSKEVKERYWKKKYDEAPDVECACGCGKTMKSVDLYGRPKKFITGHNGRKYPHSDKQAHKKAWVKRNREWANGRRQGIARKRKIKLMNRLGAKCAKCGLPYDGKNGAAFEFHHTVELEKEFSIGGELGNKSLDALIAEVDKCKLLCANCHNVHHIGEY